MARTFLIQPLLLAIDIVGREMLGAQKRYLKDTHRPLSLSRSQYNPGIPGESTALELSVLASSAPIAGNQADDCSDPGRAVTVWTGSAMDNIQVDPVQLGVLS
jgi:hypothetical protein